MKSSLSQKSKNGAKKDADRSAKMSSAHARGAIQNSIDESLEKSAVDEGLNVVVVENEGEHVSDVESDAEEAGSEEREADDEEEIFDGFNFLNTYEGRPVNNGEDDSAPRYYSSQVFEPDSEAEKGEQGNNLGESRGTAQPAANGTPRVVSQEAVQASATGTDCPRTAGNGGSAVAGNPVASAPPRAPLPVNPNCQGNVLQNGAKNATCTVSTPLIQNVNASAPTNSQRQSQQPVLNTQTTRAVVASCPGDRPGMPNLPASANMPVANESYMNTPPVNTQNANQNLETVAAAPIPEPAGPNPSEILFIENFLFRFPADKAESVNKTLRWWIEKVPKANIIEKILKLNWDNISTNCQQFERFIEKLQKKVENKIVFVDGGADDGAEDEQQGGNMPSQGGTQTSGSSSPGLLNSSLEPSTVRSNAQYVPSRGRPQFGPYFRSNGPYPGYYRPSNNYFRMMGRPQPGQMQMYGPSRSSQTWGPSGPMQMMGMPPEQMQMNGPPYSSQTMGSSSQMQMNGPPRPNQTMGPSGPVGPPGPGQTTGSSRPTQMMGPPPDQLQMNGPFYSSQTMGPSGQMQMNGPPRPSQTMGLPPDQQMNGPAHPNQTMGPSGPMQMVGPSGQMQMMGPVGPNQTMGPSGPVGPPGPAQTTGPPRPTQMMGPPPDQQMNGPAHPSQTMELSGPMQTVGPSDQMQMIGMPPDQLQMNGPSYSSQTMGSSSQMQMNGPPRPSQTMGPSGQMQMMGMPPDQMQMNGPVHPNQTMGPSGPMQTVGPQGPDQTTGPPRPMQMMGPSGQLQMNGPSYSSQTMGSSGQMQMVGPSDQMQMMGPVGPNQTMGTAGQIQMSMNTQQFATNNMPYQGSSQMVRPMPSNRCIGVSNNCSCPQCLGYEENDTSQDCTNYASGPGYQMKPQPRQIYGPPPNGYQMGMSDVQQMNGQPPFFSNFTRNQMPYNDGSYQSNYCGNGANDLGPQITRQWQMAAQPLDGLAMRQSNFQSQGNMAQQYGPNQMPFQADPRLQQLVGYGDVVGGPNPVQNPPIGHNHFRNQTCAESCPIYQLQMVAQEVEDNNEEAEALESSEEERNSAIEGDHNQIGRVFVQEIRKNTKSAKDSGPTLFEFQKLISDNVAVEFINEITKEVVLAKEWRNYMTKVSSNLMRVHFEKGEDVPLVELIGKTLEIGLKKVPVGMAEDIKQRCGNYVERISDKFTTSVFEGYRKSMKDVNKNNREAVYRIVSKQKKAVRPNCSPTPIDVRSQSELEEQELEEQELEEQELEEEQSVVENASEAEDTSAEAEDTSAEAEDSSAEAEESAMEPENWAVENVDAAVQTDNPSAETNDSNSQDSQEAEQPENSFNQEQIIKELESEIHKNTVHSSGLRVLRRLWGLRILHNSVIFAHQRQRYGRVSWNRADGNSHTVFFIIPDREYPQVKEFVELQLAPIPEPQPEDGGPEWNYSSSLAPMPSTAQKRTADAEPEAESAAKRANF